MGIDDLKRQQEESRRAEGINQKISESLNTQLKEFLFGSGAAQSILKLATSDPSLQGLHVEMLPVPWQGHQFRVRAKYYGDDPPNLSMEVEPYHELQHPKDELAYYGQLKVPGTNAWASMRGFKYCEIDPGSTRAGFRLNWLSRGS